MTAKLKNIELAILDNHLSEYPEDKSFDWILDNLDNDHIDVWYLFDDWDADFLAEHLQNIKATFDRYEEGT